MKARAQQSPNSVRWANGYVSNMPDWTTARECAAASAMAYLLTEMRAFFQAAEAGHLYIYDESRRKAMIGRLDEVADWVKLGIDERGEWSGKEPLDRLKYHVTGAIERGEKEAIASIPLPPGIKS